MKHKLHRCAYTCMRIHDEILRLTLCAWSLAKEENNILKKISLSDSNTSLSYAGKARTMTWIHCFSDFWLQHWPSVSLNPLLSGTRCMNSSILTDYLRHGIGRHLACSRNPSGCSGNQKHREVLVYKTVLDAENVWFALQCWLFADAKFVKHLLGFLSWNALIYPFLYSW